MRITIAVVVFALALWFSLQKESGWKILVREILLLTVIGTNGLQIWHTDPSVLYNYICGILAVCLLFKHRKENT